MCLRMEAAGNMHRLFACMPYVPVKRMRTTCMHGVFVTFVFLRSGETAMLHLTITIQGSTSRPPVRFSPPSSQHTTFPFPDSRERSALIQNGMHDIRGLNLVKEQQQSLQVLPVLLCLPRLNATCHVEQDERVDSTNQRAPG